MLTDMALLHILLTCRRLMLLAWACTGIASDPIKLQRMREMARARNAWAASGAADAHPVEMAQFTLLSTKNSEHVRQAFSCRSVARPLMLDRASDNVWTCSRRPGAFTTQSYQTRRSRQATTTQPSMQHGWQHQIRTGQSSEHGANNGALVLMRRFRASKTLRCTMIS